MILSYLYVPVALGYLGIEKYGVWSTILTLISWIGYFDIGIGNGLRNRLTEVFNRKEKGNARKIVSSAYAISILVMMAITIIFVLFACFIDWYKVFGVQNMDENLRIVVIESIVLVAFNFVMNLCVNVLYALQKASVVSLLQLIILAINYVLVLIIREFTVGNLTILAFVYGASFVLVNFIASIILFLRNNEIAPNLRYVDWGYGSEIVKLGFKFFVIQICALILFATDSLIISYLYGAKEVTPYSTVNKLFMAVSGIYIAFITPLWSSVTKDKTNKDITRMERTIRNLFLLMIPFVVATVVLFLVFQPLADWWLKQHLDYSIPLLICGSLYCVLNMWCSINAYILNGLEVMKPSLIIAILQAVVNIPLSLLFALKFNMESTGVLLGTVISMTIAAVCQPIFVARELKRLKQGQENDISE